MFGADKAIILIYPLNKGGFMDKDKYEFLLLLKKRFPAIEFFSDYDFSLYYHSREDAQIGYAVDHPIYPDLDFKTCILHEIGHYIAIRNSENAYSEKIAWKYAYQLAPHFGVNINNRAFLLAKESYMKNQPWLWE